MKTYKNGATGCLHKIPFRITDGGVHVFIFDEFEFLFT